MESLILTIGKYMFHIFGIMAVIGATITIISKNLVHSVVCFLLTMIAIAGCYICLSAEFLAVAQLLIYAGGIVVLFLFVIMLVAKTNNKNNKVFQSQTPYVIITTCISTIIFATIISKTYFRAKSADVLIVNSIVDAGINLKTQNAQLISRGLFSGYLLPFEILSVILLVALVGAVVMAKTDVV